MEKKKTKFVIRSNIVMASKKDFTQVYIHAYLAEACKHYILLKRLSAHQS